MMPNKEDSTIELQKILNYLLDLTHEVGKFKAQFFIRFGFSKEYPEIFEDALKTHAIERTVDKTEETIYGTKYKMVCEINTPDKRNPCIVTVWIINKGTDIPTFITAYPNK